MKATRKMIEYAEYTRMTSQNLVVSAVVLQPHHYTACGNHGTSSGVETGCCLVTQKGMMTVASGKKETMEAYKKAFEKVFAI